MALLSPPKNVEIKPSDWAAWGYSRPRNAGQAIQEHGFLQRVLQEQGVAVHLLKSAPPELVDACYVCDPVLMMAQGALINRMGKEARRPEASPMRHHLASMKIPILPDLSASARLEGGDCVWLDDDTLAVGVGDRSNMAAVECLRARFSDVNVVAIELPQAGGPEACFHLGSILSMVDRHLALVYSPLVPKPLWDVLDQRGIQTVDCGPAEFQTQACNVLCTAPSRVIVADGNPITKATLEAHGVSVTPVPGQELMVLGTGGPTCLVLPLKRG